LVWNTKSIVLPWYFVCTHIALQSVKPPYYSSLSCTPTIYFSTVFSVFCYVFFLHRCDVLQYHSLLIILHFLLH
jgi:hypothetical protein